MALWDFREGAFSGDNRDLNLETLCMQTRHIATEQRWPTSEVKAPTKYALFCEIPIFLCTALILRSGFISLKQHRMYECKMKENCVSIGFLFDTASNYVTYNSKVLSTMRRYYCSIEQQDIIRISLRAQS